MGLENESYIDRRVIDMSGVKPELLRDPLRFRRDFSELVAEWGLTLVDRPDNPMIHHFTPSADQPGDGLSAVALIMESDANMHTWPEHGYGAGGVNACITTEALDRMHEQLLPRYNPRKLVLSKTGGMEVRHRPELIWTFVRLIPGSYRVVEERLIKESVPRLEDLHDQEIASGGFYRVKAFDYQIPTFSPVENTSQLAL